MCVCAYVRACVRACVDCSCILFLVCGFLSVVVGGRGGGGGGLY